MIYGTKLMALSRFFSSTAAAVQIPGLLSLSCVGSLFVAFGSADAKRRLWKNGALSLISSSTACQEKFMMFSLDAVQSREGFPLEQRFLHSFETSEQTRSSMASLSPGHSIAASARALKLLPLAKAFPRRCRSLGKSLTFFPDS